MAAVTLQSRSSSRQTQTVLPRKEGIMDKGDVHVLYFLILATFAPFAIAIGAIIASSIAAGASWLSIVAMVAVPLIPVAGLCWVAKLPE